jgi:hypothetical protein
VIAVHLFGNVAPVAEIEALGVPVLEDAAQTAGSTVIHAHPDTHAHTAHTSRSRSSPSFSRKQAEQVVAAVRRALITPRDRSRANR